MKQIIACILCCVALCASAQETKFSSTSAHPGPFASIGITDNPIVVNGFDVIYQDKPVKEYFGWGFNKETGKMEYMLETDSENDTIQHVFDNEKKYRWLSMDPVLKAHESPYVGFANNPIIFIDPNGEDILVAFTGGFFGGHAVVKPENAGTIGKIVSDVQNYANANCIEFDQRIYESGATASGVLADAVKFIQDNYSTGERVVVYGYSWGGDFAVELSEALKVNGINVELLVTVDATDGPLQGSTVDRSIPDNVDKNLNIYQTAESGTSTSSWSSNKSSSGSSDSSSGSSSDSGTSNFPGSRGAPNTADDPSKTTVDNYNVTGKKVTHGNIDEVYQKSITNTIQNTIKRTDE